MRYSFLLTCILVGCNTHQPKPSVATSTWKDEPKIVFSVPEMSDEAYHIYMDVAVYDTTTKSIINKANRIIIGGIEIDTINIKNHGEWDGQTPVNAIELYYPVVIDDRRYTQLLLHKITKSQEDHKPELWMFILPDDKTTEKTFSEVGELPFNIVYSTDSVSYQNTGLPLILKERHGPIAYWGTSDYPDKSAQKHFSMSFKDPADLVWQFHKTRHPDYKKPSTNQFKYAGREIRFGWPWVESDRGHTTIEHLISVHGYTRESLQPYLHNQHLLDRIHGYAHTGQGSVNP